MSYEDEEIEGFEVVGDDDYGDVEGDVLGDVLGDDDDDVEGAGRFRRRRRRRRMRRRAGGRATYLLPSKPGWRDARITPGVQGPQRGLQPLPLVPNVADGVFSAGGPAVITFEARPQRPFRPERLLAGIARAGTVVPTSLVLAQGIFVGTGLQQVDFGNLSLDNFRPDAFGVRLALRPAEPGILIRIPVLVSPVLVDDQTIAVNLIFLGQTLD